MTQKLFILMVLLCAIPGTSNGYGYGYGYRNYYPYAFPYYGYGIPYRLDARMELAQIRRDLRNQRLRENLQQREHEKEIDWLRRQSLTNHQISARQACYYRSTGGFELCADLFTEDTQEFAECEGLVILRNPVCNELPLSEMR